MFSGLIGSGDEAAFSWSDIASVVRGDYDTEWGIESSLGDPFRETLDSYSEKVHEAGDGLHEIADAFMNKEGFEGLGEGFSALDDAAHRVGDFIDEGAYDLLDRTLGVAKDTTESFQNEMRSRDKGWDYDWDSGWDYGWDDYY